MIVIPGRADRREPGTQTRTAELLAGFRIARFARVRNDD